MITGQLTVHHAGEGCDRQSGIWEDDDDDVAVKVLAPVTKVHGEKVALKDLGDTGQNTNGHSVCLRLDYGDTRILLTGDLNKKSMEWIINSYGDRIGAFNRDVAKACHHGSGDISYTFLEHIKVGATVISSGDAEGHAHPRPEVVAASAVIRSCFGRLRERQTDHTADLHDRD